MLPRYEKTPQKESPGMSGYRVAVRADAQLIIYGKTVGARRSRSIAWVGEPMFDEMKSRLRGRSRDTSRPTGIMPRITVTLSRNAICINVLSCAPRDAIAFNNPRLHTRAIDESVAIEGLLLRKKLGGASALSAFHQ